MTRGARSAAAAALAAACSVSVGAACRTSSADTEARAVAELRAQGRALFFGRAGCVTCHKHGDEGQAIVGPNLGVGDGMAVPVAERAPSRRPGLRPIAYVVESIVEPDAFTVPTYARGVMKRYEEPPVSLTDDEIVALAVFVIGDGVRLADVAAARAQIAATRARR